MRCLSSMTVACSTTSWTSEWKTKQPGSTPGSWPWVAGGGGVSDSGWLGAGWELRGGAWGGAVSWDQSVKLNKNNGISPSLTRLFRWRIVTRLGIHPQRRQTLRWQQLHLYLTPFAVMPRVLWTVSKHILVA